MTFTQTINSIIKEVMKFGFDTEQRVKNLRSKLTFAFLKSVKSEQVLQEDVRIQLTKTFDKLVPKASPSLDGYTLQHLKPKLQLELEKRIIASANLIKWRREESIAKVLKDFEGWMTSVPKGGSKSPKIKDGGEKFKALTQQEKFFQRRIAIDQTAKLTQTVRELVAIDKGAIAGIWRSKGEYEKNYKYRPDHLERARRIYIVRDSWADKAGFIKPVHGYMDDITKPAEEVYCRCSYIYLYTLRDIPVEYLTAKGKKELQSPLV